MPDRLAVTFRSSRPGLVPARCVEFNDYVLPVPGRTFRRDELLEVARANGHDLSADMLLKWRQWRLIPGPTAGGPTGKGRGKGQVWPEGAGWRVAWLSRWLANSLTYDVLRVALWPWTLELEDDAHVDQLIDSVARVLVQDRDYHDRRLTAMSLKEQAELDPYVALMYGDPSPRSARAVLRDAGLDSGAENYGRRLSLVMQLGFEPMQAAFERSTPSDVRAFSKRLRAKEDREKRLTDIFWASPIALARMLLREFYAYHIEMNSR